MSSDLNPPPQKGSGASSVIKILLIVFAILAILCCGVCGLFGYGWRQATNVIKEQMNNIQQLQPARDAAFAAIQADEACKEALGEPMHATPAVYDKVGEVDLTDAPFTFMVSGSKKENALVNCRARQEEGVWRLIEIKVKIDDQELTVEPLKDTTPELNFDTGEAAMPEEKEQ